MPIHHIRNIISWFIILQIATQLAFGKRTAERNSEQIKLFESIIKIEAIYRIPDYSTPWNTGKITAGSGTGFLIAENLFLTNAHVVSNSQQILITKYGKSKKHEAQIVHVAHDCDLALIKLIDPSAFQDVAPLKIGEIPKLESTVTVLGYPIGGQRISITRGVVSRIDFNSYSHSRIDYHLVIQIDAATNPGNSGGPVLQNGKVVGVSFQGFTRAENIGYIIPTPVVNRFIKDVEDGKYDNYVDISSYTFDVINPAQREALKLEDNDMGKMVTQALEGGSAHGKLKLGDVLLKIDGHDIDSDGRVWIDGERIHMAEIVERKFVGDKIKLDIVRNGESLEVEIELNAYKPILLQTPLYDNQPRYIVFAGLVLQPLSLNLNAAYSLDDLEIKNIYYNYINDNYMKKRPEPVILTKIIPDQINTHIKNYTGLVVDEINGKKILTLKDAYEALNPDLDEDFYTIKLLGQGRPLVLESTKVAKAQERIMRKYNIPYDKYLGKLSNYVIPEMLEQRREELEKEAEKNN